jgi:DNA-binding response OmpR family regulator
MRRARLGKRVLVVEDDAQLLALARLVLCESGYASLAATTGAVALNVLESDADALDAVLLDLGLHDMPGSLVLIRARQIRPDLPVVVATDGAERPDGARIVIRKPYGPEEVVQALDAVTNVAPA